MKIKNNLLYRISGIMMGAFAIVYLLNLLVNVIPYYSLLGIEANLLITVSLFYFSYMVLYRKVEAKGLWVPAILFLISEAIVYAIFIARADIGLTFDSLYVVLLLVTAVLLGVLGKGKSRDPKPVLVLLWGISVMTFINNFFTLAVTENVVTFAYHVVGTVLFLPLIAFVYSLLSKRK